jgi:ABC-2 type transport system ATP-binding protein
MAAIELDGVTKRYGGVRALHDVDLTVDDGEIFGFLGPNGAGKSTTIDVLLDFVRPTAGEVTVLGHDAQAESRAVRRRTGVLPDGFSVYDRLSGRKHLRLAIDSKGADDDVDDLLERVGLADAGDRPAGDYSTGMAQRLVLAMALVGDPDLLILDEPSTGLDPNGARRMRELIRAERERGATVFFSSHILEQVEAVCDRVGILRGGELVAVDTIEGLREAVGGGDRLTVTVDRVTDEAVAAVESLDGVADVRVDGTRLAVDCDAGAKTAVLSALEDAGVEVRDFATTESSLAELFAAYTTEAETETEVEA